MANLPDDFPNVTHDELLATIDEVFRTGANEIDPREIFGDNGDDFSGVPEFLAKNVSTMFPHEESVT
jgi:hypothetical protein